MAATMIVEDGSVVAGANSYVSIVDLDVYFENMGYTPAEDDNAKAILLIRATRVVDSYTQWEGQRLSSSQNLQWPRTGAYYPDGHSILSGDIPQEVKDAVCEVANASNQGSDIQPVNDQAGNIKSESVKVDVIQESKEYFEGSSMDRAEITALVDALAPLLGYSGGGAYGSMPVVRV